MMLPILLVAAAGCLPKGPVPLTAAVEGPTQTGDLEYTPTAILTAVPGMSIDVEVRLDLTNKGSSPIRVDLSRSRISVDGVPFQACRYGRDMDPTALVANIAPEQSATARVICKDIPRPGSGIQFAFGAAGTGEKGLVTVDFLGLGERL